jgi:competence protein ComEA
VKYWKQVVAGILIGLLLSGLVHMLLLPKPGSPLTIVTLTPNLTPEPTATVELIQIQIAGAVINPGVYTLPKGSTVNDAIFAAGGTTPHAQADLLNLLTELQDGQRIYIPGEAENLDAQRSLEIELPTLININTATQSELESLPGIGAVKAKAIIAYRNEHGYFLNIEDIMNVDGIGPSTFEQFKDLISVEP